MLRCVGLKSQSVWDPSGNVTSMKAAMKTEGFASIAEKELHNFVVETFGDADEDGDTRWDPEGHEGGLLVKCADSATALSSTVPSRLPLSIGPAFVRTLCCSAQPVQL
jgi:hypothetical protein